jgi:DNA-binding XRE family transcriptional regulator
VLAQDQRELGIYSSLLVQGVEHSTVTTRKDSKLKPNKANFQPQETPKPRRTMRRVGTIKNAIKNPKNVGERLASKRLKNNLSQAEVAERVQISNDETQAITAICRSTYSMYESGQVIPSLAMIEALAKVFRCSPGWLAFGH